MDIVMARLFAYTRQGYEIKIRQWSNNCIFIKVRKGKYVTQRIFTEDTVKTEGISFLTTIGRMTAEFEEAERGGVLE